MFFGNAGIIKNLSKIWAKICLKVNLIDRYRIDYDIVIKEIDPITS